MGYACPVCGTPQQDAEHLANHLAITGMVRDEEHRDWLDEHAEGWRERSPAELGDVVAAEVESVDYDRAAVERADLPADADRVMDDGDGRARDHDHTDGPGHAHGHDHTDGAGHDHDHAHRGPAAGVDPEAARERASADNLDEDVEEILEEARELTRQQFEDAAVEGADESEDAAGSDADGDPTGTDEA